MAHQRRINVKISLLYWSGCIATSGKIDNETQQTTSTVVLIAQKIAELKLFQLIQLIHFDDCIQCDRHVLKPETTKRNGRNETIEMSETTETSKIISE